MTQAMPAPGRADPHGRTADDPREIPARGWKEVLLRVKKEMADDHASLLSAGVAFYALMALAPALVALVSLYGLVAEPSDVSRQVTDMLRAAPVEVRSLIETQLQKIIEASPGGLGVGIAVGFATALWAASSGMANLVDAVNASYGEHESRGFVKRRLLALGLTFGAIGFVVAAAWLVALPSILDGTAIGPGVKLLVSIARFPLLGVGMLVGLAVLYRYAPDRDNPKWSWVSAGSIAATVLWVAGSAAFSFYVGSFGKYNETYGSLGAVVVLLLWLYLTAMCIVLGAELNAELEHQTAADTTAGHPEPLGRRGAVMADTVAGVTAAQPADESKEIDVRDGAGAAAAPAPAFISKENSKLLGITLGAGAVAGAVVAHALEKD
jgi:membrane protein